MLFFGVFFDEKTTKGINKDRKEEVISYNVKLWPRAKWVKFHLWSFNEDKLYPQSHLNAGFGMYATTIYWFFLDFVGEKKDKFTNMK